jgi:23S rRNA pseudouridine1911/1915/1917 synthase
LTPTPEWIVAAADAGTRLDKFLAVASRLGSRAKALAALDRGKVFVDDREAGVADASRRVAAGETIRVWIDRPGSARVRRSVRTVGDLVVVFEDDDLVVVNKPAGLLTVPLERRGTGSSALEQLAAYLRPSRVRPLAVHRIDEDTSGLVVFAKHARARETLQAQFRRREPARIYLAVVAGRPDPSSGIWRDRLVWDTKALIQKPARGSDGTEAITEYRIIEPFRDASLLELRLVTGRRNQIRAQAGLHGCPLIGEKRYVDPNAPPSRIKFGRYALHALRLEFAHPSTGQPLAFDVPPPPDFADLLARLR